MVEWEGKGQAGQSAYEKWLIVGLFYYVLKTLLIDTDRAIVRILVAAGHRMTAMQSIQK